MLHMQLCTICSMLGDGRHVRKPCRPQPRGQRSSSCALAVSDAISSRGSGMPSALHLRGTNATIFSQQCCCDTEHRVSLPAFAPGLRMFRFNSALLQRHGRSKKGRSDLTPLLDPPVAVLVPGLDLDRERHAALHRVGRLVSGVRLRWRHALRDRPGHGRPGARDHQHLHLQPVAGGGRLRLELHVLQRRGARPVLHLVRHMPRDWLVCMRAKTIAGTGLRPLG